ncbi:MAG: lytic transglycosylase domain-containing protein [Puia sp.]|nr:lytic transglycosylase domain-containing protein [Puia sp.]
MSARTLTLAGILLLGLAVSVPVQAWAEMQAYLDRKGDLHYRNVNETERRYRVVFGGRSETRRYGARKVIASGDLEGYIQTAAAEQGVDPHLVKAIIKAESNFNAHAVSLKGAQGLMQLMPGTAHDFQVSDPFDPMQNINGGTRYLRSLLDSYNGNVELSLAAYNAGPRQVEASGGIPPFLETRNYIIRVLQNYRSYTR